MTGPRLLRPDIHSSESNQNKESYAGHHQLWREAFHFPAESKCLTLLLLFLISNIFTFSFNKLEAATAQPFTVSHVLTF